MSSKGDEEENQEALPKVNTAVSSKGNLRKSLREEEVEEQETGATDEKLFKSFMRRAQKMSWLAL